MELLQPSKAKVQTTAPKVKNTKSGFAENNPVNDESKDVFEKGFTGSKSRMGGGHL